MKNVIELIEWIKQSNRWKHLLGGVLVGLGSNDLYCAAYSGVGVASALELKDKLWGSTIDLVDWSITLVGVAIGFGLHCAATLLIR